VWIGNLEADSLSLHAASLGKDLAIDKLVMGINTVEPDAVRRGAKSVPPLRAAVLQPFALPLGGAAPAMVDGTLDMHGAALHVKGEATLQRLQQCARTLGIGAPKLAMTGLATLDATLGGGWNSSVSPQLTGTAVLKNANAVVPGLAAPVEIFAGRVEFEGNRFTLRNTSAGVGHVLLTGSASFPRSCDGESPCEATFDLTTDEWNAEQWNAVLNPHVKKTPWYAFGGAAADNSVMVNLRASGELVAHRITLGSSSGTAFATAFAMSDGVLSLRNAHAKMFGGEIRGDWKIDFTGQVPVYEGNGAAVHVQADQLTTLLKSSPGSGTVDAQYKIKMSGVDEASLLDSTAAETTFTWTGGALRLSPDARSAMRVRSGAGKAVLDSDGWRIPESLWKTPGGIFQLSGSIARSTALDLEFSQPGRSTGWQLGGTLSKPQSEEVAAKQTEAVQR
jgi:hypothetical protein